MREWIATLDHDDMMDNTTSFRGSGFIDELMVRDGMTSPAAKTWIKKKTGYTFDPDAIYKVRWPPHESSERWAEMKELRVHIMSDVELEAADREYRKHNMIAPRRPREPSAYEFAKGAQQRAEAARRERSGTGPSQGQ